ncbi:hypothetical protein SMG_01367 [Enterococcus faecium EnGen0180]|uniref:Uncharacterized protein n=1 Tax=Enterococcus faecium EnGen0180 TaxID=1157475 RepID=A0A829F6N4_ENTFC|nr:hypothetical protein SMG_01367 [Enterococcus faecium EnGen0180]
MAFLLLHNYTDFIQYSNGKLWLAGRYIPANQILRFLGEWRFKTIS